jgi:2'-5' RNA ligase
VRLFLALELPPPLLKAIASEVERHRGSFPAARWVKAERMHLTLVFLGETPPAAQGALVESLRLAFAPRPPFTLTVTGAGGFPPRRPPRVLWLGVQATPPDALGELQRACRRAVVAAAPDLELEERPFRPHLTLARCPQPWSPEAVERFESTFRGPRDGAWYEPFPVREGVLIHSQLSPSGPRYLTLGKFPLAGAA